MRITIYTVIACLIVAPTFWFEEIREVFNPARRIYRKALEQQEREDPEQLIRQMQGMRENPFLSEIHYDPRKRIVTASVRRSGKLRYILAVMARRLRRKRPSL